MKARPVLVVLALVLAACRSVATDENGLPRGLPRGTVVIGDPGRSVSVSVEIAETEAARARGLMGRRSLAPDAGMVFLEDHPVHQAFWMKNTFIPLSVGFWGPEGRILRVLDMVPCHQDPCPLYDPGVEWTRALEVNRGFFERHDLGPGDPVRLVRAQPA